MVTSPYGLRRRRPRAPGPLGAVVLLVILAFAFASYRSDSLTRQCSGDGGRLSWHTVYRGGTTYYCITPDGRLLWIR